MSETQLDFAEGLGLPQGSVAVNRRVWFQDLNGNRAVFVDQTPFYCYPLADQTLHRFCAIELVEAGVAKVKDVCQSFDIHPRNFSRFRSKFRQQGMAGLILEKKRPQIETNSNTRCWNHGTLSPGQEHLCHRDATRHQCLHRPTHLERARRSTSFPIRRSQAFADINGRR